MVMMLAMVVGLSGCTSKTEFGECVGLGEVQDPKLNYKVSGLNVFMGIIFWELIIPPVIVVADDLYCPVGAK